MAMRVLREENNIIWTKQHVSKNQALFVLPNKSNIYF